MAFKTRNNSVFIGLMHHSDKGSQYCSNEYIRLLSKAKITISMGSKGYENPYAERLNGIIKNDYLRHYNIFSINDLERGLKKAIRLYNHQKPQKELGYLTPIEYENILTQTPMESRAVMKLYNFNEVPNRVFEGIKPKEYFK